MTILELLRKETRDAHIELEQVSGAAKILDRTINLEQYVKILQANYIAYAKAESQLAPLQNESIATWIKQDLQAAGAEVPNSKEEVTVQDSNLGKLGVQYVIEGSLLGGAMIAQHLTKCPALENLSPQQFYAPGSPERAKRWRNYVAHMNSIDLTPQESKEIVEAANQTFNMFKQAFLHNS
ncbi:hypothetical protein AAU57_02145 [Nonlabens sp. YIK11]|uniref:biliverdin-producing heme oxygenase n=1 Tax=Nonlabens sp. YIK11 TaxID=1453349 RepID=UPI0006DCB467|nr:biliverdin-producing heme oxygenase [Nonlabens sp. YIK11]KQC32256.1 hypothetical protein AAU57_02145 [Nonlabens sp. YIK11]